MKYYIPDWDETPEDAQELKLKRWDGKPMDLKIHPRYYAEEAAEYIHERDGWESDWPMIITVIDDFGAEHRFSVDRDFDPVFSARKL